MRSYDPSRLGLLRRRVRELERIQVEVMSEHYSKIQRKWVKTELAATRKQLEGLESYLFERRA